MDNQYEEMVVTFVDILGFQNLIDTKDVAYINNIIRNFYSKNFSMHGHRTDDPNNDIFNSFSVSDTIIRFTKLPEDRNRSELIIDEINALAWSQLSLLLNEDQIVIRGGLSIGKMYYDYNYKRPPFFGPAYNRAYEIENKIALNPRIVIDKKLKEINKLNNRFISLDKDNELFIDYLEITRDNELRDDLIINHKNSIVQLIEKYSNSLPDIKNKYLWLASYHNEHCMKYNYPDDWRIDLNSINVNPHDG